MSENIKDYEAKEYPVTHEEVEAALHAQDHPDTEVLNEYLCESCDKRESLTEEQAYNAGWDYPPFIGIWGVVSPRTCPDCTIETTAYWALLREGVEGLNEKHQETIKRILAERMVVSE